VRARQDALRVAFTALVVLFAGQGCGATFHSTQTVTFVTRPGDGAAVYRHGLLVEASEPGTYKATIFLADARGFVAAAPGKKLAKVDPEVHVDGLAVALDVLWSLTIVGVAAPISDALLGTFPKAADRVEIQLEPDPVTTNPLPVYAIEGAVIAASEVPAPSPAPAKIASCKTHLECKGGLVCPAGECVKPACVADKECGRGRSCDAEGVCRGDTPGKPKR
jgi:hypothetical protein